MAAACSLAIVRRNTDATLRKTPSGEPHASARIRLVPADPWRHHGLWADGGADSRLAGTLRARGGGGRESRLRISADSGRLHLLGSLDLGRVHGGALGEYQAADRRKTRLYQSGADGQDDLDLRPDVGRTHLRQSDCGPERERGRGRRHSLPQGGTLRAEGGGGLDPHGEVG